MNLRAELQRCARNIWRRPLAETRVFERCRFCLLFANMLSLRRWAIMATFLRTVVSQNTVDEPFALWPTVDQGTLAQALNISDDCLDAL
jgi:hypothetical protein